MNHRTKTEHRRRRLRREGCGSRRTLSIRHVPDSERDCACPTDGEGADKLGLAVIHLREEPDALTSARPDPSGGYHASDIPTGISSIVRKVFFLSLDLCKIACRLARVCH